MYAIAPMCYARRRTRKKDWLGYPPTVATSALLCVLQCCAIPDRHYGFVY